MLLSAETRKRKKHLKPSHGKDASFNHTAMPPTDLGNVVLFNMDTALWDARDCYWSAGCPSVRLVFGFHFLVK
jgi:hypothetical protein